jgi:hypothetical protein
LKAPRHSVAASPKAWPPPTSPSDVPAQLAARARLLNTGHARKSDPIDAAAVATVAQHHRRLHPVRAEDGSLLFGCCPSAATTWPQNAPAP